jgi:hypothetical protein
MNEAVIHQTGQAEATINSVTRVDITDIAGHIDESAGILSTVRSAFSGGPSVAKDDALVTYQGMQMTLKSAASMGIVNRDAQGHYTEINTAGTPPAAQAEPLAAPVAAPAVDPLRIDGPRSLDMNKAESAQVDAIEAQVPDYVRTAAVEQIIRANGIEGLSTNNTTMEATAYTAGVTQALASYQAQADESFRRAGIDGKEFGDWARANHPKEIASAMRTHAATRNPSSYQELISKFLVGTVPQASALKQAGYPTKFDHMGTPLVQIGGMWVSQKSAAKAGLL